MLIIKLAWRNIWRKKKRTFISISAILFAVVFSIFIDSLQKGTWDNLINNILDYYYGHAQLQKKGYWDNPSIDDAYQFSSRLENIVSNQKNIAHYIPRLESFALAASGTKSYGVMLIGTDPEAEQQVSGLHNKLVRGEYFSSQMDQVLISEGVSKTMKLNPGDTLILISQGYHGVNAAGKYTISGIISLGSPELNSRMVYMPLNEAQQFYGADSLVTSVSLNLTRVGALDKTIENLRASVPSDQYDIKTWMELMPDLVQAKELDRAGNYVVYFILYTVIAFGIFATILMMIKEREYELGVMLSVGMNRLKLSLSLWTEIFMIGILGVLAGSLVSLPFVIYFKYHPIKMESMAEIYEKFGFEAYLPTTVDIDIFITQAIIIFCISILIAIYPIARVMKLDIIKALKG